MLRRRTDSSLLAHAPAKLNLYLRVVGKRADGYHEIETVMTAVSLYDTLIFSPAPTHDLTLRIIRSESGRLPVGDIPGGEENLVLRAARLLQQLTQVAQGAQITLIKRIPTAAGLGGGSSDAATTLDALNRFWNLALDRNTLIELAGRLGSDIPFFLGPTSAAVCRGRGELLEPLPAPVGSTFVIAKPPSGLSTPLVYRHCRPEPERNGCRPMVKALLNGRMHEAARHLRNDLQTPATDLNRDVRQLACLFDEQPVWGHQLSGSGTAYFGLCRNQRQGQAVAGRLRSRGIPWVRVVQSC